MEQAKRGTRLRNTILSGQTEEGVARISPCHHDFHDGNELAYFLLPHCCAASHCDPYFMASSTGRDGVMLPGLKNIVQAGKADEKASTKAWMGWMCPTHKCACEWAL